MFTEVTKSGIPTLPPLNETFIHPKKKPSTAYPQVQENLELPPISKKVHPAILQLTNELKGRVSIEELSGYQADKILAEQIMKIAMLHVFKGERFSNVTHAEIALVIKEIVAINEQGHLVIESFISNHQIDSSLSPHIIRRVTRSILSEHIEQKLTDRLISGGWKRDAMRLLQNVLATHISS